MPDQSTATNLTDEVTDSWGNAWVEVTHLSKFPGRNGEVLDVDVFVVSIIGYSPISDSQGSDEAWTSDHVDPDSLAQVVRNAQVEADRLDGGFK